MTLSRRCSAVSYSSAWPVGTSAAGAGSGSAGSAPRVVRSSSMMWFRSVLLDAQAPPRLAQVAMITVRQGRHPQIEVFERVSDDLRDGESREPLVVGRHDVP